MSGEQRRPTDPGDIPPREPSDREQDGVVGGRAEHDQKQSVSRQEQEQKRVAGG